MVAFTQLFLVRSKNVYKFAKIASTKNLHIVIELLRERRSSDAAAMQLSHACQCSQENLILYRVSKKRYGNSTGCCASQT